MRTTALALFVGVCAVQPLPAQTDAGRGSLAGLVVNAATGLPLPGAVVALEPVGAAATVVPAGSPFLASGQSVVTGLGGGYRFGPLPPGDYRLTVRHLGYRPAVVDVALGRESAMRVSVALIVNPIRLEPMDVRALTAEPYGRTREGADGGARLAAEDYKDRTYLSGDATVLTHGDVVESVTLGETDLFRALQRLPGVSARDDFSAALWTRGAPWSQTRVTFDGLPLFNPVHAIGVFAGVNPDAVGSAAFLPGVRSAAMGEGAAGVLSIGSRRAAGPGTRGLGELSMVSGRAAVDWGSAGGRMGLMVAARRSYVDLATRVAQWLGGDSAGYMPYAFYDAVGRFDADLGRGVGLEASALTEEDGVRGSVPDFLRRTRGSWGNRLGRVTVAAPLRGLAVRTTVGVSRFAGLLDPFAAGGTDDAPVHGRTRNTVTALVAGTELGPASADARRTWALGAELQHQRQHFLGQYPRPYPVVVLQDTLRLDERLTVLGLWGERRWPLGANVTVEAGLRAEVRPARRNAPPLGLAPRLLARYRPGGGALTLSAGAGRSWQYTQALAPAGPSVGPDLYLTDVWLLASDTVPALRSDVVTAGAELWLGRGWIAAANGWARRATGVAVPDPTPGTLTPTRPIQVAAVNEAGGLDLSLRRIAGRWTMSAGYSLGRSILRSLGYVYYAPADRRHAVDVTAMAALRPGLRLGAALTASSGAPFSRFILGCDSTQLVLCTDSVARTIERPNAGRTAGYAALDLLLDWSHAAPGHRVGAFLQLRNVWNAANAVTYTGSIEQCTTPRPPTLVAAGGGRCDRFHRGVGLLPLVGLRVAF